jgi:Surface antigen variable number repeat
MKKLLVSAALVCLILSPFSPAQKRASRPKAPADPHQLLSLKVTGTKRYTDKEILAASGLQLGRDVAEGDLKEAAQILGESGIFSGVAYSFSYSDAGVKAEFQITDDEKATLVPTDFENFVWFTDAELVGILKQRVPLFKNSVPASGRMADRVNESLQALLTERHLPGRVEFLRESKQDGSGLIGVEYRVSEVSTHIRNVEFPGASPDQTVFLGKAAHILLDAEYFRSKLAAVAKFDLLPLYLQRGYLRATFGPAEARVVTAAGAKSGDANTDSAGGEDKKSADAKTDAAKPEDISPDDIEVDAILPVTPGKIYSVSGVTWKGNSAITTDEATHVFHLAIDHPADAVRLTTDEDNLTKLYKSRGYMTATIKTEAHLDDEKSTVQYDMNVTEGDLYNMGELEIIGIDSPSKDRLTEAWKLREGQPYNADYTRQFLDDAPRLLPRGLQFSVSINEELDKKGKLVDVTLHFKMQ